MKYIKLSKIFIILSFVLFSFNYIYCMRQKNKLDLVKLKKVAKSFLVTLYLKNDILKHSYVKNKKFLDYAVRGKKEFENSLKIDFPFLVKMEKEANKKYRKHIDKKYNYCIGSKRFESYWDFIVMNRSPISFKIKTKEGNTYKIFEKILGSYGPCYIRALYTLFVYPIDNKYLKDLYKEILMELIKECSSSFWDKQMVARYCNLKSYYHEKLSRYFLSVDIRRKIEKNFEKEWKKCKLMRDYEFYKARFFLNQVPELRKQIFSYGGKDCLLYYEGKDCCLKEYIRALKKQDYSCFSPSPNNYIKFLSELLYERGPIKRSVGDKKDKSENILIV